MNLRMLPMSGSAVESLSVASEPACDVLSLELLFASHYLSHLRELMLLGRAIGLDCVPCLPSLQTLTLSLELLPAATKLELLLCRLPNLRCTIRCRPTVHPDMPEQNATMLPALNQLAQYCPRLIISPVAQPPW
jgi:hypothetical protein